MQQIIFYTKLNCHLCDDAYRVLLELVPDISLKIVIVDITHLHNVGLSDKYGDRIPVVAKPKSKTEINWPFTATEVRDYLIS